MKEIDFFVFAKGCFFDKGSLSIVDTIELGNIRKANVVSTFFEYLY